MAKLMTKATELQQAKQRHEHELAQQFKEHQKELQALKDAQQQKLTDEAREVAEEKEKDAVDASSL
jgi:hypothetical protein